ncbi:MAG: RNase adapter RapZ [Bacteroidota bacterium]
MDQEKERYLLDLFEGWAGEEAEEVIPLQPSGSYREYFRIKGPTRQAIGVYHANQRENAAFVGFTKHFRPKGIAVPDIYAEDLPHNVYLLRDLGDLSLFNHLAANRKGAFIEPKLIRLYEQALADLAFIQIEGGKDLNYDLCYPRDSFDEQSIRWDLNYFKYYFLRLARIPFDEDLLEKDFQTFTEYLLKAKRDFFLYRDFQARNILIHENRPYFIDYQGGRKGALQYDVASILYQAKADLPPEVRTHLVNHYLDAATSLTNLDRQEFLDHFDAYVVARMIQVMGAYGFRGFYERRPHFLESIPYAVKHLTHLLQTLHLPIEIPTLKRCLEAITQSERLKLFGKPDPAHQALTVSINSFSYKHGVPQDPSGHGGGFVFDCRSLNNPGRYAPYKKLTGRDRLVIDFLKKNSRVEEFLSHIYTLVDESVEVYLSRNFTNLSVNFGCTGGQHRSVYCADQLAAHLRKKYQVNVVLHHVEQEKKNWKN